MPSSAISTFGRSAFLYAFFIEQPHNTGTIARTANNILFFICLLFQYPDVVYYCIYLCVNKVENPGSACWESLPKWRKSAKSGRDSRGCLLGISTQMAQISEKGRDFRGCFLRISTQTAQIGKIGRDSQISLLEFSTQMAVNSENGRDSQAQLIENLYPNSANRQNMVEIPGTVCWESLPKQHKSAK